MEGLEAPRLGSRKARILLKVLALARSKPVSTEFLADCVWPDGLPTRAADQLSVLVSRLRSVLGPAVLVRSEAGYSLAFEWLDLDAHLHTGFAVAGGGAALGAQAGEARLREVADAAGFSIFRRAAETPFNLVLEGKP